MGLLKMDLRCQRKTQRARLVVHYAHQTRMHIINMAVAFKCRELEPHSFHRPGSKFPTYSYSATVVQLLRLGTYEGSVVGVGDAFLDVWILAVQVNESSMADYPLLAKPT
jgi:hypothetical protein